MNNETTIDEIGAHVSSAGGCCTVPGRAAQIGAAVVQMFTKTPNQWKEPEIALDVCAEFTARRGEHGVGVAVSHDSYLINLASPDAALFAKSYASFVRELVRCRGLGIDFLVTHPGNATDGDRARGIAQNADAIGRAVEEAGGDTVVLIETTAGTGHALGASFEELAELIRRIATPAQQRVGVCFDTCHVFAAGYDLRGDYGGVMRHFDATVGAERLRVFHLNDSKFDLGARRDRHAGIGEGFLGHEAFRVLVCDERFAGVPKVLETPKGDDHVAADRENLRRLRALRREAAGLAEGA